MTNTRKKTSISEDTLQKIMDLIRNADYMPGDRLPGERQLVKDLDVSRTSVREALRKLEAVGLIEIRIGKGTFVKNPSNEILHAALLPFLITDRETIRKLFEIREYIEVEAAFRAASKISAAQLAKMRYWQGEIEKRTQPDKVNSAAYADVEFHRLIIEATGNDILVNLIDNLGDLLRDLRLSTGMFDELLSYSIADHNTILTALETGDSQAAKQAMQTHLKRISDFTNLYDDEEYPAVLDIGK